MIFGEFPVDDALGAILAHSLALGKTRLKKGTHLGAADILALQNSGITHVLAAKLEAGDIAEDEAARSIGAGLLSDEIEARAPFAGRVNLMAKMAGIIDYDDLALAAFNAVDEGITLALLPPKTRVQKGQMIATAKIIPYGVSGAALGAALGTLGQVEARLHPFAKRSLDLIITTTPDLKSSLIEKGENAVRERISPLGLAPQNVVITPHETPKIAAAIAASDADMLLILTAFATTDRHDIAPSALLAAGGEILRYGIPVDPGNLLFLGKIGAQRVVGLPGCVRSPAVNGADFVLERLAAGLEIKPEEFAQMGAGGLLKEEPTRPQPRLKDRAQTAPKIATVILAAGASSRMKGRDKLLEAVDGQPLLSRMIHEAQASQSDDVFVVLPQDTHPERHALVMDEQKILNPSPSEGLGSSLRLATQKLAKNYAALVFLLADLPEIRSDHINRLIAAYAPEDGREIIRAASASGQPGHPVLFGERFFEPLMALHGDEGAKSLFAQVADFVEWVRMEDNAPITDLDTPEDWENWRARHSKDPMG